MDIKGMSEGYLLRLYCMMVFTIPIGELVWISQWIAGISDFLAVGKTSKFYNRTNTDLQCANRQHLHAHATSPGCQ